ncbi:MAG: MerR family transcriptional regulator [Deltaproteobacteria bacterium]|nr:MerR family transcriptional regulator [Deltaproteobacteria bacterium]
MRSVTIPDKLYFKIGEVAKLLGLEPYVLRYWETEFREIEPIKSRAGQRLYRKKDVETALTVRQLLYHEGYTIEGARKKIRESHRASSPSNLPFAGGLQKETLTKIRQELEELAKILK